MFSDSIRSNQRVIHNEADSDNFTTVKVYKELEPLVILM